MKKISTRIVITVLICSMVMSIIVGATSIIRSRTVIEKEARENLHMTQQVYADNINEGITVYEQVVNDTYQIVNGTIDTSRLSEENYLENYSNNILSPIMLGIEEEIDKSGGIYIVLILNILEELKVSGLV